jgi:beta-RFAP synthase
MFSFGDPARRQFGGVGAMIERPGLQLRMASSDRWEATGPLAERALRFAHRWAVVRHHQARACRIEVLTAPPQHVGLGVGTQLALAVGAGLNAWVDEPPMSPAELTACMGRGQRSAVGTYGFFSGGLVIEAGRTEGDALAPLVERVPLPEDWRFVLLRPGEVEGLSGEDERSAFRDLPPVPEAVTRRLWGIAETRLAPAARQADFSAFAASVYDFGVEAGRCFAPRQGGVFASERLARWVAAIRSMGVAGVGQSSWGPTLFAVLPGQAAAESFVQEFQQRCGKEPLEWLITPPNNTGARIEVERAL